MDAGHDHGLCIADTIAAAETRVTAAGGRMTPLRKLVLELVCASHTPAGAYDLIGKLERTRSARAAPPTVYRTLDFLMNHGLIHRIASLNAYVACFGPRRPHDACLFICERCRTVDESDVAGLAQAIERKAASTGFSVRGRTIEVTGVCRACAGR